MAISQILLVGHTHHDVGYTNSPRIIDRMHAAIVPRILDLCELDGTDSSDAFRWTFEVSRPVLNFLADATEEDRARLARLVAGGRISVTGGYLNMTQLQSEAESDAAYDRLAALASAGIRVRTEQHGDVNGISWGSVAGMRRAGIDRLVMALNPDHGRAPLVQPSGFWWEGQDGARIFVWLSTHYGIGEEWGIVDGDVELAESRIDAFVRALNERDDYPYDTAVVHAANDNRWPTPAFLDVVRHWNRMHPDVPMRTATIDDALDVLVEQAQATDVRVVRGEWADWWSHGHGSTAREVAVYREARSFARAAQSTLALSALRGDGDPALATVLGYRRGPVRLRSEREIIDDLHHVDDQLLLFTEHTWGSWETYSKPHSTFSHSHWNAKAAMAYDAWDNARDLAIEGMYRVLASGRLDDAETDAGERTLDGGAPAVVLNPTERDRTEPVTFEVDGRRYATAIATVPAFGSAIIAVPEPSAAPEPGEVIETSVYRVAVDPARGGVTSIIDRRSGRELVDQQAGLGLGALISETVPPDSEHPMVTHNPKEFHPDHPGPDFDRVTASASARPSVERMPGSIRISWDTSSPTVPSIHSSLTLYDDLDVIDVDVHVSKPESFAPESIFVAFPFAVDDPTFLLETAGAVFEADAEQLPDTSKDWYSIQHAIAVNGADGILWGSVDAPLVQLGRIRTGEWAHELDTTTGHVYSWLMNNLHFTNFQARQEVTRSFRYRFVSRPDPISVREVRVFGRNLLEPLQARQYDGPVRMSGSSGLRVSPDENVLVELRPVEGGSVRMRLRNVQSEPIEVTATLDGIHLGSVLIAGFGVEDLVTPITQ